MPALLVVRAAGTLQHRLVQSVRLKLMIHVPSMKRRIDSCVAHMFSGSTISCTPGVHVERTVITMQAARMKPLQRVVVQMVFATLQTHVLLRVPIANCVLLQVLSKGWTTAPSEIIASVPVDYQFCIPIPDANNPAGPGSKLNVYCI